VSSFGAGNPGHFSNHTAYPGSTIASVRPPLWQATKMFSQGWLKSVDWIVGKRRLERWGLCLEARAALCGQSDDSSQGLRETRWPAKAGLKGLNELLLKGRSVKYCC
jgi:hypothetical protein